METNIVIFLAFVSVTVISNTLLVWFAYRALTNVTSKVTGAVSEVVTSPAMRESLNALRVASDQAIVLTDEMRRRLAQCEPVLDKAEQNYRNTLVKLDTATQKIADGITTNLRKAQDAVAAPAVSFVAFAASVSQMMEEQDLEE